MPLADDLVALASLAGNTVVAAAATDAWETVRKGIVRLFGRGGERRAQLAESWLDTAQAQLAAISEAEVERARPALAQRWADRLADLIEEDPAAADGLKLLVGKVQALLPTAVLSAANYTVIVGRDQNIATASGVAAGQMRDSVVAGQGGTAIGTLTYQPRDIEGLPVSLPPRPVLLAGREELLAKLDAHLLPQVSASPRVMALYGLGGIGKTSVAVEYAHRRLATVGLAWFMSAQDPTLLTAEFARLAAQLGVRELADMRDPVASVHAVLARYETQWLLVFDNTPNYAAIRNFLPPAGKGRVLLTSQSALWPSGQAIEVTSLDVATATEFLITRTGIADTRNSAALALELGGLPLALEQAASYVQATASSLADYLTFFQERRPELLGRGEPADYAGTVATTWSLAFAKLNQTAPEAADLLRFLASLAPEPVPLDLLRPSEGLKTQLFLEDSSLLKPLLAGSLTVHDAVAALRRYSLVTQAGPGLVLVHRLVQAVTLDHMPDEEVAQWRQAAAVLIEAAIPPDIMLPTAWSTCAALLPHVQEVLADHSRGIAKMAAYLGWSGSYAAARDLLAKVVDARTKMLGVEHPLTLKARHSMAYWTGMAGDAAGARDQLAALLLLQERVLGSEHPETLTARGNLAGWSGQAGDPVAARDLYFALVPLRQRVLGPEHPDTWTARQGLAHWTGMAGDPGSARDQLAALVPLRERVLGPEHPATLAARGNLAGWTGKAGDAESARDLNAALLPLRERVLGPEHPATLTTRAFLARWTGEAGDTASACDQYAKLLPIQERILGNDHPETIMTRSILSRWRAATDYGDGPGHAVNRGGS
jgi:hypothetical protein